MRVRIKFTKTGSMKYIGHLDTMRFFQKVLRRAGLDVAYSEGFSPHIIMSFAQPLGVGVTSEGEYFDLDMKSLMSSEQMIQLLNAQMPENISVISVVKIPEDKANKCMTLVAAADYIIRFKDDEELFDSLKDKLEEFFNKKEIVVLKKTKKNEKMTDIKPLVYSWKIGEKDIFLKLSSGSVDNLKPQLLLNAFFEEQGIEAGTVKLAIHRKELYARKNDKFIPLCRLGEEIK